MRVAIIYTGYSNANAVRPAELGRYLAARGHEVVPVDVLGFAYERRQRLAGPIHHLLERSGLSDGRRLAGRMGTWADILQRKVLDPGDFDAVICESFPHALVLTRDLGCIKVFDCPTPFVDELELGGGHDAAVIEELRGLELDIYEASDFVAFHWETYRDYVRARTYDGDNIVTLNWGCHPREARAAFASPPRAVYMGYLGGYWINPGLLAALTSSGACDVHVYGLPAPARSLGLDYRGFAGSTDVLAGYQLGLVTCSKDRLRREGFSAKHLEYISYGLPVLVPAWRERLDLIEGSVPFDEGSFHDVVAGLSDEEEWIRTSDLAYRQAERLDWSITLGELDRMIPGGATPAAGAEERADRP